MRLAQRWRHYLGHSHLKALRSNGIMIIETAEIFKPQSGYPYSMSITNLPKIGPFHRSPHIGDKRPFVISLYNAYKEAPRQVEAAKVVGLLFTKLLNDIRSHSYKPFFDQSEIDKLFSDEVLKDYAAGRYYYQKKLDSLDNWGDLLNNIAGVVFSNLYFLKDTGGGKDPGTRAERIDATRDNQFKLRQLKIIEDWIYFNRVTQSAIRSLVTGPVNQSCLLCPEYRKEGRPAEIKAILVVDDNRPFLELVEEFSESDKLKAAVAVTDPGISIHNQVMSLVRVVPFDLIIMDGQMPEMNGAELTQELRQMGFSGYIFANSDSEAHKKDIIMAGGDLALSGKTNRLSKLFQKG
jgi:CheY-like chemotaxis protein